VGRSRGVREKFVDLGWGRVPGRMRHQGESAAGRKDLKVVRKDCQETRKKEEGY